MSSVTESSSSVPEGHMDNRVGGHSVNKWLVLVVVCFAQFMVVLDATIVNVALPSIQTDLDLSATNLQWIVNAYTLVFGGFLLLGGRAADLLGRKKLFIAGTVIFSVASLVNALATSGEMLIIARGFQGLGGALTSPAALSIVTTTFDEGPDRTKALSVWGGIAAGGAAFGLLLGGILTDVLDWRWNFIINVPIGIAVIAAAMRVVPESRHESESRHFDVAGATTITSGLMVLVYAIVKAPEWGWTSVETIAWFAGAVGAARLFRDHRAALAGAAGAPVVLQHALDHGGQRNDVRRRRRHVRNVLLRLAVRAADPRLRPAAGRRGIPAGLARDHDRRCRLAAADRTRRREAGGDGRHDAGLDRSDHPGLDDEGRRHLPCSCSQASRRWRSAWA